MDTPILHKCRPVSNWTPAASSNLKHCRSKIKPFKFFSFTLFLFYYFFISKPYIFLLFCRSIIFQKAARSHRQSNLLFLSSSSASDTFAQFSIHTFQKLQNQSLIIKTIKYIHQSFWTFIRITQFGIYKQSVRCGSSCQKQSRTYSLNSFILIFSFSTL